MPKAQKGAMTPALGAMKVIAGSQKEQPLKNAAGRRVTKLRNLALE